jgi:hypothetical protein
MQQVECDSTPASEWVGLAFKASLLPGVRIERLTTGPGMATMETFIPESRVCETHDQGRSKRDSIECVREMEAFYLALHPGSIYDKGISHGRHIRAMYLKEAEATVLVRLS